MSYDIKKLDEVIEDFNKNYMLGGKHIKGFNFVPNVGFKFNFYKNMFPVYSSEKEDLIPNYFETDVKPMFSGLRKALISKGCENSIRVLEDMDRGEERNTYQIRVVDALVSRFINWHAADFKDSMLFESAVFKQWLVDNVVGVVDGFDRVEDLGVVDVVHSNRVENARYLAEIFFNNFFDMKVEIGEEFYDERIHERYRDTLRWKKKFYLMFFDKVLSIDEFNRMFDPDNFILYCNDIELRIITLNTRREELIRVQDFTEESLKQSIIERYDGSLLRLKNSTNYLAGWKAFVFKDFHDDEVLINEAGLIRERLIDSRKENENEVIRNEAISNIFSVDNLIAHRDIIRNSEGFNEQLKEFQEERSRIIDRIMISPTETRKDSSQYRMRLMAEYGITEEVLKDEEDRFENNNSLEGEELKKEIVRITHMLEIANNIKFSDYEREAARKFAEKAMKKYGITEEELTA